MIFDDTQVAFKHKSDSDLRRSLLLFSLLSNPGLVKVSNLLLKGALQLQLPVGWLVKPTVYKQFVGGVSIRDCQQAVRLLEKFRVGAILDYSVEGGHKEPQIISTLEETLRSIHHAAADPNVPFAVFKPTAFGDLEALGKCFNSKNPSQEEEARIRTYKERINRLCKAAFDAGVPIMIDAEDSWYQEFVDEIVTGMMLTYNKEKAIVFNTLQMYRHDRLDFLNSSIRKAREMNYKLGVKFVRGAYMEKERLRAKKMDYPSPIYADKEGTDRAFDEALAIAVDNLDITSVFCGTHNENSCQWLTALMKKNGLANDDQRIWFSQLYGMSDHISFNLASAGYNVSKYLPYGPVRHVMPYLFRRAEENTSIAGQTSRELRLLRTEMKRRKG